METNQSFLRNIHTLLLAVIALSLALIAIALYIPETHADDDYIVRRVLYCLDGSDVSAGSLVVTCTR
jgi:hypothetical protein